MLSATRRRVIPASLAVTGALALGLVGTAVPVQAAPVSVAPAAAAPAQAAAATPAAAARIAALRVAKIRIKAVALAKAKVGSRYRAGNAGPSSFDCSGLALYVVKATTGRTLPHYSKAQFAATKRVAKNKLQPGDLLFFFRHGAHHTGIYIGAGKMVSATNPHRGVKVDPVFSGWYGSRYSGAGRLV